MKNNKTKNIIFGTMRMVEKNKSILYWIDFIKFLVFIGVTKIHISDEYSSYKIITKIFSHPRFKDTKDKIKLIIKCSSPNFKEKYFNEKKLNSQINRYKKTLGVKKIYAIQWLWRADLKNDEKRLSNLVKNKSKINFFIKNIKKKNVKYFFNFPYTEKFLDICKKKIKVDGFTIYRNSVEKKYDKHIKFDNFKYITIRPFINTDKNKRNFNFKKIMRKHFKKKNIVGTMISMSKKKEIIKILNIINEKNF